MKYHVNQFIFAKSNINKKAKIREINQESNEVKVSYWGEDNKLQIADLSINDIRPFIKKVNKRDTVLFAKVNPNAILPSKREEDGCYDIYACVDKDEIVIRPYQIVEIPTGIASAFDPKYRFDVQRERGSTGSIGLVPRCGQIDSGYRGEWFLKMQNQSDATIIISNKVGDANLSSTNGNLVVTYPMSKAVCQAALEIVPLVETKEITYEELQKIPSQRGKGKLGSSGK